MNHKDQQKEEELNHLKKFFKCVKLKYQNLQETEAPDFICDVSKKIGIELVQYHPLKHNHGKCKRDASGARKQDIGDFINEYISVIKKKNDINYRNECDELWLLIHTSERENSIPIINANVYSKEFLSCKFSKIYFLCGNKIHTLYKKSGSLEVPILEEEEGQASMHIFC